MEGKVAIVFIMDNEGIYGVENHTDNDYRIDFTTEGGVKVYSLFVLRKNGYSIPSEIYDKYNPSVTITKL